MDSDAINSFADKMDGLDLTEGEEEVLNALLARAAMAAPEQVTGFAAFPIEGLQLRPNADRFAAALGALGGGGLGFDTRHLNQARW